MEKPYLLHVVYKNSKGKTIERLTNDSDTAQKWEIKFDAEIYVDTRYKARLRLYNYINRIR
jgi:hypothetical protein